MVASRNEPRCSPAGLATLEAIVCIGITIVLIAVVSVMLFGHRAQSRRLKDATQVGSIAQSFVIWCSGCQSEYPNPRVDVENQTVAEVEEAKYSSANIFSMLIQNGLLTPEMVVSPAETNTERVRVMGDYTFSKPAAAVNPENALWDPAFRGTPEDPIRLSGINVPGSKDTKPGNQSYAHIIPAGKRLKQWSDTYNATEACVGTRGPAYDPGDFAPYPSGGNWSLVPGPLGTGSNTLRMHSNGQSWRGNIAFNDLHVDFLTSPLPDKTLYSRGPSRTPTPDSLFVNESDEVEPDSGPGMFAQGTNAYLRPIAEIGVRGNARVWRD